MVGFEGGAVGVAEGGGEFFGGEGEILREGYAGEV